MNDKIGMYTRNEIFKHLCESSDIGMLGRSMYEAVMSKIDNLQSQLDIANKKLDEIKEKTEFDMEMWAKKDGFILVNGKEILSIIGGE